MKSNSNKFKEIQHLISQKKFNESLIHVEKNKKDLSKLDYYFLKSVVHRYLKKYSDYEKKRHLVKPGITGLAQINPEPSGVKSCKKSIKLDIFYVFNISFFMDMKILFKTVVLVLFNKKQYKDFKKTL